MNVNLASIAERLQALARGAGRLLLGGEARQPVPIPIPVDRPRRRR